MTVLDEALCLLTLHRYVPAEMRACYWLSTAARPPPRPTHRARWSRLRARLAADGELFSYLRRDFDVNAENVAVSSGEVGRGLFFVKGSEANTTVKIPIHNTLLVTDDPTGGSSIVGMLLPLCSAVAQWQSW